MIQNFKKMTIAGLVLFLTACGGGRDQVADGSIGGTGIIASGPITGFGSVFINKIEFRIVPSTRIATDHNPHGAQSDLELGQVVNVKGTLNRDAVSGTASQIEYSGIVRGPIERIDLENNTIVALGQLAQVATSTSLQGTSSIAELRVNDMVEISGFADWRGRIVVTYIERQGAFVAGSTTLTVRGAIASLDANTFLIGGAVIDYSGLLPQNRPSRALVEGLLVEVQGNELPQNGMLKATSVSIIDPTLGANEGDQISIQGLISSITSPMGFVANGIEVVVDTQTVFQNGAAQHLAKDLLVEVQGRWHTGQVTARKVVFLQ